MSAAGSLGLLLLQFVVVNVNVDISKGRVTLRI